MISFNYADALSGSAETPPAVAPSSDRATYRTPAEPTAPPTLDGAAYAAGFRILFALFVFAVLLESALAILFNWRPFVETFNARAVKPIVSFLAALAFAVTCDLDFVSRLVTNFLPGNAGVSPSTDHLLTALILAGGSAGVNNLLVALGYRQQRTPETVAPKPPPEKAWISVAVKQKTPGRPVSVYIGVRSGAVAPAGSDATEWVDLPLAGVISGRSLPGFRYFLADPGRFPSYGGHAVPKDVPVSVELRSRASADTLVTRSWGPNVLAAGAIVDLEMEL